VNAINSQQHATIVVLCSPRLSRPEIYWFHVSDAGIVKKGHKIAAGEFTEIAAGRYSKGGTAVAERAIPKGALLLLNEPIRPLPLLFVV